MTVNLWPTTFPPIKMRTPVSILREQATALGERTANIVIGRVHTSPDNPEQFRHTLALICRPLGYESELFFIRHDVGLYPVEIHLNETGVPPITARTEAEFHERLREVFARERTVNLISSLIAQSQE